MSELPPAFDSKGINVLDPHDRLGYKSKYITLIQEKALMRYLPEGDGSGLGVDLGCGYGRLSSIMARKGWKITGIDPSDNLLQYAQIHYPQAHYCQGQLPDLPFRFGSVDLILLQNVLRSLLLMDSLEIVRGIGRFLSPQGSIVVVDNIRTGAANYLTEPQLIELFEAEGMQLITRFPFRAGRWWLLYLIRYGLIPQSWLSRIADFELEKRQGVSSFPRWQYMNILFIFRWPSS